MSHFDSSALNVMSGYCVFEEESVILCLMFIFVLLW